LTSILALLSGVPALVYQVAWTREIGLLAGDEARRIFRATAEESDPEGYARMALAVMDFESGDAVESEAWLRSLLQERPGHAQPWNLLGVLKRRAGDHAAARDAFRRALAADPYLAEALGNAGLLAVEVGDLETAWSLLRRLRATHPLTTPPQERALSAAIEGVRG
jgi:Flp pilus assembly protein TadD